MSGSFNYLLGNEDFVTYRTMFAFGLSVYRTGCRYRKIYNFRVTIRFAAYKRIGVLVAYRAASRTGLIIYGTLGASRRRLQRALGVRVFHGELMSQHGNSLFRFGNNVSANRTSQNLRIRSGFRTSSGFFVLLAFGSLMFRRRLNRNFNLAVSFGLVSILSTFTRINSYVRVFRPDSRVCKNGNVLFCRFITSATFKRCFTFGSQSRSYRQRVYNERMSVLSCRFACLSRIGFAYRTVVNGNRYGCRIATRSTAVAAAETAGKDKHRKNKYR